MGFTVELLPRAADTASGAAGGGAGSVGCRQATQVGPSIRKDRAASRTLAGSWCPQVSREGRSWAPQVLLGCEDSSVRGGQVFHVAPNSAPRG